MSTRKKFMITHDQVGVLLNASKPVPYMIIGGAEPRSPQENANYAWKSLGNELGFKWDTVQPIPGKGHRHFTAEVNEDAGKDGD